MLVDVAYVGYLSINYDGSASIVIPVIGYQVDWDTEKITNMSSVFWGRHRRLLFVNCCWFSDVKSNQER